MNDTSTFGGFTSSFLTAYRDEFPKLSCLVFPILSHSLPFSVGADDVSLLTVRHIPVFIESVMVGRGSACGRQRRALLARSRVAGHLDRASPGA